MIFQLCHSHNLVSPIPTKIAYTVCCVWVTARGMLGLSNLYVPCTQSDWKNHGEEDNEHV